MTPKRSIFFDDWRDCLHAHYEYVVRSGDAVTEPTLRYVIQHAGLSEDEVNTIREQVLAHYPYGEEAFAAGDEFDEPVADAAESGGMDGEQGAYAGASPDDTLSEDILSTDAALTDAALDEEMLDDESLEDVPPDDPQSFRPSQLSLF